MDSIFNIDTLTNILGWKLKKEGTQYVGECVNCGKRKMYVDAKRTTYNCKVCDTSGNALTALGLTFDKVFRPALTKSRAIFLAKKRGLKSSAFLDDPCLGYDEETECYVWIARKPEGPAANYRRATYSNGRFNIRSLKRADLFLLGLEADDGKSPIYLTEGEWDRSAWMFLLSRLKKPGTVVAAPGASIFKAEWVKYFKGREVVFLYDNDDPGIKGSAKHIVKLRAVTDSVKVLRWPEEIPDGYDINDMVEANSASLEDFKAAYEFVHENLNEKTKVEEDVGIELESEKKGLREEQEELEPISVEALHAVFKKWMHLESCDLVDIVMGCLRTIPLPGNPIWMFIVSPPSGSKTETLMPVSVWWPCYAISTVTEKSLISGFQTAGGGDPSLFAKINGKPSALIIKDLTPLLEGKESDRDAVFGLFRDAYDGSANKIFGNGVVREYNKLHFSLLAGVTPAIDMADSVAMGERFLKFRADKELGRQDDIARALRAIENTSHVERMKEELTDACLRCLANKYDPADVPDPSAESDSFKLAVAELAFLCAHMRAVAPSDKFSDRQAMSPLQEAPPRLATQFTKLAQGLAMHFGLSTLDDERILQLIRRVALHTPDIITVRLIQGLYNAYEANGAISPLELRQRIKGVGTETVRTCLLKLSRTGAVEETKNLQGKTEYRLSESLCHIIEKHQLFRGLPGNDPLALPRRVVIRPTDDQRRRRLKRVGRRMS